MKGTAADVADPNGFRETADEISDHADQHLQTAGRIEDELPTDTQE